MQIINISLSQQSVTAVFDAVQNDTGRECGFYIEEDISNYDIVDALFTISRGKVVPAACLIDDHLVTFVLPVNLTRNAGVFDAVIQFTDSTTSTAQHSFPFKVNVVENPKQDGDLYERAYQDMIEVTATAESDITTMESYISAYGTVTPSQLSSLLSDLQNIWAQFNGQNMTTIGNRLTAMESGLSTAESDIDSLETTVGGHTTAIGTLNTNVSGLTTRIGTAEGKITTLEGLADNAVYHD